MSEVRVEYFNAPQPAEGYWSGPTPPVEEVDAVLRPYFKGMEERLSELSRRGFKIVGHYKLYPNSFTSGYFFVLEK